MKTGDLVLVSPEPFIKGALAGRLEAAAVTGEAGLPSGWLYVPGLAVTQQNVDRIMARQASPAARGADVVGQLDAILDHPAEYMRSIEDAG